MAEDKKPAARKPAAKKTTQRKRAPRKTAEVKRLEEQVAALEAKAAETSEPTTAAPDPAPPINPQRFIRNLRNVPVRFKLERHPPGHRGINLEPRGVRGDIRSIENEDLRDPIFQANNGLLFEVITADEAANAAVKQNTNTQQSVHPALAQIQNHLGEGKGEMKLSVDETPFEQQGEVVAKLNDGQLEFNRGGIVRQRGETPGTPDYISGAEDNHAPANEDPSFLSDQRARDKQNTDLGLSVNVAPVQREGIISDGFKSNE